MDTLANIDASRIARELLLKPEQVQRTLELLEEGNTIPFITRFRKDRTGGLDEEQIRRIAQAAHRWKAITERRSIILKSLQSQGRLTPELAEAIQQADSLKRLEDLYLPFRPRKQTLATLAKQRGLGPLADMVFSASQGTPALEELAASYVDPQKGLPTVAEVLQGVRHVLAERFADTAELRDLLRQWIWQHGELVSNRAEVAAKEPTPPIATASPETNAPAGQTASDSSADTNSAANVQPSFAPGSESGVAPPSEPSSTTAAPAADTAAGQESAPPAAVSGEQQTTTESAANSAGSSAPLVRPSAAELRRQQRARRKEARQRKLEAAFKDYYNFREPLRRVPPHRVLAINRGERARILKVKIDVDASTLQQLTEQKAIPPDHPYREFLVTALRDALQRLILPSLEREIRRELTEKAEQHAVTVFARNLRKLLLQPPVRGRRVAAIDPGLRSGCKLVALDEFGNVLGHDVLHVIGPQQRRQEMRKRLADFVRAHGTSVIAIGNGAGCRETEQLVAETLAEELQGMDVAYVIVNEAGASVYSTSALGREELPQFDPVVRSAVSIGRRLLDPLSELVKIEPANLGVGLYQHDVKASHLKDSLDQVVESCVNYVGVDVNTASPSLLRYVSGFNQLTARRVYEYRQQHGPFRCREELKKVPGLGETTFVQAAGFLRIYGGDNPLDATWIHPESYAVAERLLEKLGASVEWLRQPYSPPAVRTSVPPTSEATPVEGSNASSHSAPLSTSDGPSAGTPVTGTQLFTDEATGEPVPPQLTGDASSTVTSSCSQAPPSEANGGTVELAAPAAPQNGNEVVIPPEVHQAVPEAPAAQSSSEPVVHESMASSETPSENGKTQPVSGASCRAATAYCQDTGLQTSDGDAVQKALPESLPAWPQRRALLAERIANVDVAALAQELGVGELLLRDMLAALTSPGRDPREDLPPPVFRRGIMKLDDLKPGMELTGTVLNVVDFGAFVDIGLADCGLVHISRLADRYIRDPHEVVGVGDVLRVWVVDVDRNRRRVSLTAIPPGTQRGAKRRRKRSQQDRSTASGVEPATETLPASSPESSSRRPSPPSQPHEDRQQPEPAPAATRSEEQPGEMPDSTTDSQVTPQRRQAERPQRKKPTSSGRQRRSWTAPAASPVPAAPSPAGARAFEETREPLRSFSDLLQFYRSLHGRPRRGNSGENPR